MTCIRDVPGSGSTGTLTILNYVSTIFISFLSQFRANIRNKTKHRFFAYSSKYIIYALNILG